MTEQTSNIYNAADSEEVKPFVPFTKKGKTFAIITEVKDDTVTVTGKEGTYDTVTVTGKRGTFTFVLDSIENPEEGLTVNLTKAENGNWIPELEPKTKKTGRGNPVDLTDDQMAAINSYF